MIDMGEITLRVLAQRRFLIALESQNVAPVDLLRCYPNSSAHLSQSLATTHPEKRIPE